MNKDMLIVITENKEFQSKQKVAKKEITLQ